MVSLKSRSFPVMGADHQLVGMISREDVIRALKEATQGRLKVRGRATLLNYDDSLVFY
jgi:CBS domain-containing protein